MARVIVLQGGLQGGPREDEQHQASEAITPGHLIEPVPTGDTAGQWRKHATAGGDSARIFALERGEMGLGIDDAYAINDYVKAGHFGKGMRVNGLIASGQNLKRGNFVESAGDGTLRVLASGVVLGSVAEDTGAVTALSRVKVDII